MCQKCLTAFSSVSSFSIEIIHTHVEHSPQNSTIHFGYQIDLSDSQQFDAQDALPASFDVTLYWIECASHTGESGKFCSGPDGLDEMNARRWRGHPSLSAYSPFAQLTADPVNSCPSILMGRPEQATRGAVLGAAGGTMSLD